ncbi:Dnae2p, partial [Friedmanniomyces endolithicus]
LATRSNFSFLEGASHPKELVLTAILLGQTGLGLADRNTLAGVVRAWSALKALREEGLSPPERVREGSGPGEVSWVEDPMHSPELSQKVQERAQAFKLVLGARLSFCDGTPDVVAYPETREGWANLCRLLTVGNSRAPKGRCDIRIQDLCASPEGLLLILMPTSCLQETEGTLKALVQAAPGAVWLGATMGRSGRDRRQLARLKSVAHDAGAPLVALNDVLYHDEGQRDLQDVLTCIRQGMTLETAGRRLEPNAERRLKPPHEMQRLFADAPEALDQTQEIIQRVCFDLKDLKYNYPEEPVPPGWEPQAWLEKLVEKNLGAKYPGG